MEKKKRKALGRGLAALISEDLPKSYEKIIEEKKILDIDIDKIEPNPHQPRKDLGNLDGLIESIKEKGIIHPLIITSEKKDRYQLIAGERRWQAAKAAGLNKVPAIVISAKENEKLELALIENIQRKNLNPIEEAKAYKMLISNFGLKQEEIAKRVGKDRSTITNILRILSLPQKIQDDVSRETLTQGHARTILSIADEKQQLQLRDIIIKKGLSVRQTEQLINNIKKKKIKDTSSKTLFQTDPHLFEIQNKLKKFFKTKVSLKGNSKKGTIEIEYYSLTDLERILELLGI